MDGPINVAGFEAASTSAVGFSINSFTFAIVGLVAIIACRLSPRPEIRNVLLLLLNVYFLKYFIDSVYGAALLSAFLLSVYCIGHLKTRPGVNWSALAVATIVSILWFFLFLIKDPGLLAPSNPFWYFPVKIVGISYIVFRSISYVLEVELVKSRSLIGFINYVVFFPTLLAGPIERYTRFQGYLTSPNRDWNKIFYPALNRILNGLIKKFVFADNLMAFGIFSMSQDNITSIWLLWLGTLLMLFLIYLDFSGYCDIVIGLAKLMGFDISENFDRPFASRNVQEFWARWHMTLGSLIRDFVFTPLNKLIIIKAPPRTHFALITLIYMLSMILVAMWHGTTVGFMIFGILHGSALIFLQLKKTYGKQWLGWMSSPHTKPSRTRIIISCFATYSFVSISLICWYRTPTDALRTFKLLLGL